MIDFATYDARRDRDAVVRIWHEVGWLDTTDAIQVEAFDYFIQAGPAHVARLDGTAECAALSALGSMQYQTAEVPLAGVTGVVTSPIARRRGLAGRTTARVVADCAQQGAGLAILGIFDQGYYDRLGFAPGGYEHRLRVDPRQLNVPLPECDICRLTTDDWQEMHECRVRRTRRHGFITLDSPNITRAETMWSKNGGGFGIRAKGGRLSHFVWCATDDRENGPLRAVCVCYSNYGQFLELVGVLKGLQDQIRLVSFYEPPDLQLQDLVDRPFRHQEQTRGSQFQTGMQAFACWQARICDLPLCVRATHAEGRPVRFNLVLEDPLDEYLPDDCGWRGVGGRYVISFGPESNAVLGEKAALPTLRAGVGGFTRLWLGVQSATGLAATGQLLGPDELIQQLDDALKLPAPRWDWGL